MIGLCNFVQGAPWGLAASSSGSGWVGLLATVGFAQAHSEGHAVLLVYSALLFVTLVGRDFELSYVIQRKETSTSGTLQPLHPAFS